MEINYRSASFLQVTVLCWCFIIVFQFHKATGLCIFGPGPDCVFPCRCSDSLSGTSGGMCNSDTGVCETGACKSVANSSTYIGQAWSGDGCQTGNVALEKTATVVHGAPAAAEKAVDGFIGASAPSSHCISIDTQDSNVGAWWMVDFGSLHKISSVTVYNSYDSTESTYLENFYFKHGIYPNHATHTGCSIQYDPVPAGGSVTHICPVTARYISINKYGGTWSKMTLCELVVTGHKYYNVDCSRCAGTCHQDLWCEQCKTGWLEPDCRNVAPSISSTTTTTSSTTKQVSATQPVTCPIHCSCDSITNQCQTCNKWYIPDGVCNKHIDTITLEFESIPVVKNPTRTTLTVNFKQDDLTGISKDIQQYYFYQLKYKMFGESGFKTSSLIQHDSNQGVTRAQRTFILKDLIEGSLYEITLAAYRWYSPNNWNELIAETSIASAKTICPAPVSPEGINILSKANSMNITWKDLGYYNCNRPIDGVIEYRLQDSDITWSIYSLNNFIRNRTGPGDVLVSNIFPGEYDLVIKLFYNATYLQSKVVLVNVENSGGPTSATVCDCNSNTVNVVVGVFSTVIIILIVSLAIVIFFFIKIKRKLDSKGEAHTSSNVYYNKSVVSVNDIEVMDKDNVVYQDIDGQAQDKVNSLGATAYEELQVQKEKLYDNEDVKPYSDLQPDK